MGVQRRCHDVPVTTSPSRGQIRRWRRYLADERSEADGYRQLAERRTGEERDILLELADAEKRHECALVGITRRRCGSAGRQQHPAHPPAGFPGDALRGPFCARLDATRRGPLGHYGSDVDATDTMAADERIHGEVLRGLAARGRLRLSGTFRAAVFGANDGLVSNLALVLGIGATGVDARTILFTGVAGLLAGALSMAAGEYVSVQSQRELLQSTQPDPESQSALPYLDVDANELALVYRARGMQPPEAKEHARTVLATLPLRMPSRGKQQESTRMRQSARRGGRQSQVSVFLLPGLWCRSCRTCFGATGWTAVVIAAVLVGIALLGTGAIVGLLSGASPLKRALRQLGIGYGAAAATYLLGRAFGATVG